MYEFCDHHTHDLTPPPSDPYGEDGYCCWCGNGRWKSHFPGCVWADATEGVSTGEPFDLTRSEP